MRVDVIDIIRLYFRILHGGNHRFAGALAVFGRRRDVVGIAAHAEAQQLGVDRCASRLRVLEFLQHDTARAVPQHEAVTLYVERTTRTLWFIVARRHGFRRTESADRERGRRILGPSGNHDFRIAVLDHASRETDAMRRRCAGSHDRDVRPGYVLHNTDIPGRHVDDAAGNVER